jgi:hypothetical protein
MTDAIINSTGQATTAGTITVYNVNSNTGEYIGSTSEYLMIGVGIPAMSYVDAPPVANTGYAVCRNSAGTAWVQTEDHRGVMVYDTTTLAATIIQTLGPLSATQTLLAPATPYDVWNGTAWVTNTTAQNSAEIAAAVAEQTALISAANTKTQLWQTQLMLGIITAADKTTLTAWMTYVQAVQAVDTSTAPNITWPIAPSS